MGCISFKTGSDTFQSLETKHFEQIVVIDIDGNVKKIGDYLNNKKLLIIVNTASYCGYTKPNYTQLVDLYTKYKDKGLEILGFPCNQFYAQEYKSEDDIKTFVKTNYNVDFPMFTKIDVNGEYTHELFIYLKKKIFIQKKKSLFKIKFIILKNLWKENLDLDILKV
jgi:glutathione peroxidase